MHPLIRPTTGTNSPNFYTTML